MLFSKLPKNEIANIFIWQWLDEDIGTSRDSSYIYYDSKTVLNEWKKLVGPNLKLESYMNSEEVAEKFSSDGTIKKCLGSGWGNNEPAEVENKLLKVTKTDEEIVLYEVVKFMEFGDDDYALWYKDYNKTVPGDENELMDANYKFIYKNDGAGNYYFYGVEKIK